MDRRPEARRRVRNATEGYTLVNASLAFRPFGDDNPTSIVLSANNIFDVVARRHASFLKDYAPLAGRDFRISARLDFVTGTGGLATRPPSRIVTAWKRGSRHR